MAKSQDLLLPDNNTDTPGGVFFSTGNLMALNLCKTASSRTLNTAAESLPSSPSCSWRSSADEAHNRNVPLIVCDPDHPVEIEDEQEALGKILSRCRRLPHAGYYCNNHVLVNQERVQRLSAPLYRLTELDEIAREHARRMAESNTLFHCTPDELRTKFSRPSRRMGENVRRGDCIANIHKAMMKDRADRSNIMDRRYTHMGMATARGSDGNLYLCQIFRG